MMAPPADPSHRLSCHWAEQVAAIRQHLARSGAHAGRCLVLVPYAQLMAQARQAWRDSAGASGGFVPRFETTRNWAQQLGPHEPGELDHSPDPARNRVVAQQLLEQGAGARLPSDMAPALIEQLLDAAAQLAPLASAVRPEARAGWASAQRDELAGLLPGGVAAWEGLVQAVAIEWVGHSTFATDVLWQHALPGQSLETLVLLQGMLPDPLGEALAQAWGERGLRLPLAMSADVGTAAQVELHACADAQDEAQRAAACVLAEIAAGRAPVALVAQDRVLTRRISALLQGAGLPLRDETGWRLSTSQAAARLLAVLRGCAPRASTDDVLDAFKHMPCWRAEQVNALERQWRRLEVASWAAVCANEKLRAALPENMGSCFEGLHVPRPLGAWLADLARELRRWGLWDELAADRAGQAVLQALWLPEDDTPMVADWLQSAPRKLGLPAFTAWVRDVLEAANFVPLSPAGAPVVVLPMAQMLARPFAAVVAAGCDDVHLSAAPEPPGLWTAEQRASLGLPGREVLAASARAAWTQLLCQPRLHVLWREHEGDEPVLPNPWVVQLLQAQQALGVTPATDLRLPRELSARAVPPPLPSAPGLLPASLSASSYSDLRECPYRFFALRQLGLLELPELDDAPDKRDMGNWLHQVLKAFHEVRPSPRERVEDQAAIDVLATQVAAEMGLDAAAFLPFRAAWPSLREGYLAWLHGYEERSGQPGPRFDVAEVNREAVLGRWHIRGTLDRIDRQPSPEGAMAVVIDYKTETRATTEERIKHPMEDTQLAFYAALLPEETLRAAYLSLGEGAAGAAWLEQSEVLAARDALSEGLPEDMDRVAAGAAMPALGEGRACDFCAARGLCRKDFWTTS
jgi:ATP-dependent helicase/nuclease subunit B